MTQQTDLELVWSPIGVRTGLGTSFKDKTGLD